MRECGFVYGLVRNMRERERLRSRERSTMSMVDKGDTHERSFGEDEITKSIVMTGKEEMGTMWNIL